MRHGASRQAAQDRDEKRKDPMAILWASSHRSKMAGIAKDLGVSSQFVSMVLYGRRRSKDGRIERALKELGAPVSTWK